ncbi:MAG: hypothetical protein LVR00_04230 [Rhabdochlamydiaceae bacterium]|jgi:chromosome segregation ATPase
MTTNIGSTQISEGKYFASSSAQAEYVDLTSLKQKIEGSNLPDLIGTIIRLIAEDAKGNFSLDVSHTKATLKHGQPPTTVVIKSTSTGWLKTVIASGNTTTTPIFECQTENTEYTRLTTLFIATMRDARNSATATHAPLTAVATTDSPALPQPLADSANTLQELTTQLDKVQTSLKALLEKHQALEAEKTQLETTLHKAQEQSAGHVEQINTLNDELKRSQEEYRMLKATHDGLEETNRNLEGQLEKLAEKQASIAALEAQIEALQGVKHTLEAQLFEDQKIVDNTKQLLAASERETKDLEQTLRDAKKEHQILADKLEAAEQKNRELSTNLAEQTRANDAMTQGRQAVSLQLEKALANLGESERSRELMETQLAITSAEIEALKLEKLGIETQLAESKTELKKAQSLKEHHQVYAEENDKLKTRLSEAGHQNDRLESEINHMTAKMEKLEAKEAETLSALDTLEKENAELKKQVKHLQQKLKEYQGIEEELKKARDLVDKQQKEIEHTQRLLKTSERKLAEVSETVERERKDFEAELGSNQKKIQQLLQELQQLNKLAPSAELEEERNDLETQLREVQERYKEALARAEGAERAATQSFVSLQAEQMKLKTQEQNLASAKARVESLEQFLKQEAEKTAALEALNMKMRDGISETVEHWKKELSNTNAELHIAEAHIESLEKEKSLIARQWQEVNATNASRELEYAQLQVNAEKYRTDLIQATRDAQLAAEKTRAEKNELSMEHENLIADMKDKSQKLEGEFRAKNQELTAQIKVLTEELETLKATPSTSSSKEVEDLKRRLEHALREKEKDKQQLDEYRSGV